jgi:hypothetical protein
MLIVTNRINDDMHRLSNGIAGIDVRLVLIASQRQSFFMVKNKS